MADDPTQTDPPKKKPGLLVPLLIGVLLAVLGGGGGYWAVTMGPFAPEAAPAQDSAESPAPKAQTLPPIAAAFVPLETLVISLGPEQAARHLMFSAALEVDPAYLAEVTQLSPRVLDVLNGYLRVISLAELSDPTSLGRLRAQMLRRIQIVTGAGKVQDLLVTQFVVN
jgi:flagellar FliL protein